MLRAAVGVAAIGLIVLGLAYAAALLLISPDSFKPEIVAAVKRATGRELTLRGPMRLGFGLPPWLIADDVLFANAPGGSREAMLTLDRLTARVAFWPLLAGRLDLIAVDLSRPDLLLETNQDGRGNWLFTPAKGVPPPTEGAPAEPAVAAAVPASAGVAVQSVHVRDARITWRNGASDRAVTLTVPVLDAEAGGPNGALHLTGQISSSGRALTLAGSIGSLARLLDPDGGLGWPVTLEVQGEGVRLALDGAIARPLRGEGVTVKLDGNVTDFTALAPFLPPTARPPNAARGTAQIADSGSHAGLASLTLHVDGMKLPGVLPDLVIDSADITAPSLDKPAEAIVKATLHGSGIGMTAHVGSLAALLPGAQPGEPVPVELTADAGQNLVNVKGTALAPATLSGLDVNVLGRIVDLAGLQPLLRWKLPPLKEIGFEGQLVSSRTEALAFDLRHAALTAAPLQLGGDLRLRFAARPSLSGALTARYLDVDALLAALAQPPLPQPAVAAAPAPEAPATAAAPGPAIAAPPRMIPDAPLPFALLDGIDANLDLTLPELKAGGVTVSATGHLALQDGRLTLDPLTGQTPHGPWSGRVAIDARGVPPTVAAMLHLPDVPLAALDTAFGLGNPISGTALVDADLTAKGETLHALAATLDGHIGTALSDGEIDNRALLALIDGLLRTTKLPEAGLASSGRTRLRCLAVRLDARQGAAQATTLVGETTRLQVVGSGTLDLGEETLALHLRPMLRSGPGLVVPVQVGGRFLAPKLAVESGSGGKAAGLVGAVAAAVAQGERGDVCLPALASVAGSAPPPAVTAEAPGKPPKPADVLKKLLR